MGFVPLRTVVSLLALGIGTGCLAEVQGQEQQPEQLDPFGDPLPEGAVARLGCLRLVHLGRLSSVAVSPDGKRLASGVSEGKQIYLNEKILHQSDQFTVTTGDRVTQATIGLWDTDTGKLIREIGTPDAPVSSMSFGNTDASLFAGCGRYLCAWDASTGKKLWQQEAIKGGSFHEGVLAERLFLAKGKLISLHGGRLICRVPEKGGASFFYHSQQFIRFWDSTTGKSLPLPKALESTIHPEGRISRLLHEVAVSRDGRYAAVRVSEADPEPRKEGEPPEDKWKYPKLRLEVINLQTGKVVHTVPQEKGAFRGLAFAPDAQILAFATGKAVSLMETANGRSRTLMKDLPLEIARLTFLGRTQIAVELVDSSAQVWDVATAKWIEHFPLGKYAFEMARTSRVVATIHGNTVRVVDLASGKPMHDFPGHRLTPLVRFAMHSKNTLLSRDPEKAFRWDSQPWKVQERIDVPGEPYSWYGWFQRRNAEMDFGLSIEKQLYIKQGEKRLELRDSKTDQLIRPLANSTGKEGQVYFSAAGNRLFAYEPDCFHLFDVETGRSLAKLPNSSPLITPYPSPELSPLGQFFAHQDKPDQIDLYQVNSGKLVTRVTPRPTAPNRTGTILRFRFSRDDQILLGEFHEFINMENGFARQKHIVVVWELKTGQVIRQVVIRPQVYVFWRQVGMKSHLNTFAVSNDQRLIAFADKDGKTIEVWEVASGTKRGELTGHVGPVVDLAFSADDRHLVSSSEDTTLLVWDMNRPFHRSTGKDRLSVNELTGHWKTLFQPEAQLADMAIGSLVRAPRDCVPFLKQHLRPIPRPDSKQVENLLSALDSDDFQVRSRAELELERFGELLLEELRQALKQAPALNKRRLLEDLVRKAQQAALPYGTLDKVGQARALEVLERIGSSEAKQVLRELAAGAPAAPLTSSARAVLARLDAGAK